MGGRANFPAPNVVTDTIDPLWCPLDGNDHTSKSAIRALAKEKGAIEIGNERQYDTRVMDEVTKDDVGRATQMVREGYKPVIADAGKEGWQ